MDDKDDLYNMPISVKDAVMMFKRNIRANERPYQAEVKKINNRKIEEWRDTVLDKISDSSGKLPASRVGPSWQAYEEGLAILEMKKLMEKGVIVQYPEEVISFWRDVFELLSVEEMYPYGSGAISMGWSIITNHMKMWCSLEKYKILYGNYSNPLGWEKNRHKHLSIMNGELLPFWNQKILSEIREKVFAILGNQVEPKDITQNNIDEEITPKQVVEMLRRKIHHNDKPFISDTSRLNHEKIRRWKDEVLVHILSNGKISRRNAYESFKRFDEGLNSIEFRKLEHSYMLPKVSEEIIHFWRDLFEESSITILHDWGTGNLFYGWALVLEYIKKSNIYRRNDLLYGLYDTPLEWEQNYPNCKDVFDEDDIPFWIRRLFQISLTRLLLFFPILSNPRE